MYVSDGAAPAVSEVRSFDAFYGATARRTLALARSLTRSWSDAEDLVQDAYADARRRWESVGAMDDPAAWVRRAVVNRSASRWRRLGREVRALGRLAGGGRAEADGPTLADDALWTAIADLSPQQRRVVALHYVDDRSVEEIAALLGCSTGSVKTHLSRARAGLRAALGAAHDEEGRP